MEGIRTFKATSLEELENKIKDFVSNSGGNPDIVARFRIISLSHASINDATSPTGQYYTGILVYERIISLKNWDGEMF